MKAGEKSVMINTIKGRRKVQEWKKGKIAVVKSKKDVGKNADDAVLGVVSSLGQLPVPMLLVAMKRAVFTSIDVFQ